MSRRRIPILLWFLISLHALSLLVAAINMRPLFGDGAYFAYKLLGTGHPFWDPNYQRYFSVLLQLPAALLIQIFYHAQSNYLFSLVYSLCMSMHPILSLYVSYRLLKYYDRADFFIFPVLSFAIGTQALMGFPALIIPETLSLYWPMLIVLLYNEGRTRWEVPLLWIFTVCLAFSYELAILFFFVNAFLLRKRDRWLLFGQFFAIAFILWRLFGPLAGTKQHFIASWTNWPFLNSFRLFQLWCLQLFGLAIVIAVGMKRSWDRKIAALVAIGALIIGIYNLRTTYLLWNKVALYEFVWLNRITVIPFVTVIAGLFIFLSMYDKKDWFTRNSRSYLAAAFLVAVALVASLAQDAQFTHIWRRGYEAAKVLRNGFSGCNVLSDDANIISNTFIVSAQWLPYLTMGMEENGKFNSIFFVEPDRSGNSCRNFGMDPPYLPRFELEEIIRGPIRLLDWDYVHHVLRPREIPR